MKNWTVGRSTVIGIFVLLTVIALVQVLPQVDLPDTAFHEDSAPIVRKLRVISVSTMAPIAVSPQSLDSIAVPGTEPLAVPPPSPVRASVVPALLCCFLC